MQVYQGREFELILNAKTSLGAIEGLDHSDITLYVRSPGSEDFQQVPLSSTTLKELGYGYYGATIDSENAESLGNGIAFADFSTPGSIPYETEFQVIPVPRDLLVPEAACLIKGNMREITGDPMPGAKIEVRGASFPARSGNTFVSITKYEVRTDAFGEFEFPVLRNQKVEILIPLSGVRYVVVVPDQETALLVDILPS